MYKELIKDLQKENERLQNLCNQMMFERYIENKSEKGTNTVNKNYCNQETNTEIHPDVSKLKEIIENNWKNINHYINKTNNANMFKKKEYKKKLRMEKEKIINNLNELCTVLVK